jgi:chromo domain-containing protein 1
MTERTLLKQTRAEFEDDAISITSSQSEQYSSDQEFLVERILAEKKGADGKMYFLVFWANYPEEKSTWEPKKNIQDPEILQIWKERKDQEYKGLKPTFNIARFDARHQKLAQAKADRHRRRKIKRKRLGIPVSPDLEARRHTDDSDSTEAVESDGAPEDDPGIKMKSKAPQRGEKPSKLPPIQPDSSDDETSPARIRTSIRRDEHESDGAGTSDDSLIGDLKKKPAKKKAKKKALQAMREKRATQGPSKVPTAQDKPAQKKAPGVCYIVYCKISV